MAIFACQTCGYVREVADSLTGRKAACPRCKAPVVIAAAPDRAGPGHGPEHGRDHAPASATPPEATGQAQAVPPAPPSPDQTPAGPRFHCPSCGFSQPAPAVLAGKAARCPRCKAPGRVEPPSPAHPEDALSSLDVADLAAQGLPPETTAPAAPLEIGSDPGPAVPARSVRERLLAGGVWPNVRAGALVGLAAVLAALCQGVLVFAHPALIGAMPLGLTMALTGAAVAALVFAARSASPELSAGPESTSTAALCVLAASLATTLAARPGAGPPLVPTVAVALAAATLACGLILGLLGRLKAGQWLRAVPFQVLAGIMAACGLILVQAALRLAMGTDTCFTDLWDILAGNSDLGVAAALRRDPCARATSGLGLALALVAASRRWRSPLVLPLGALAASLAAHVLFRIKGLSLEQLTARGWLLSFPEPVTLIETLAPWPGVDWAVLADHAGLAVALAGVVAAGAVLKISALEPALGRELDLDREMKALGAANAVSALTGGCAASLSLGRGLLARRSGAASPLAGLTAGVLAALALVSAHRLLPLIPSFVLIALPTAFGLSLMVRWLADVRRQLPAFQDYLPLLVAFGLIAALGLPAGMGCAVALALAMSLAQLGRMRAVKHTLSGASFRSNVDRAPSQAEVLAAQGARIHVLRLQGFLSLAAVSQICGQVRVRTAAPEALPLRYLVLDFTYVSGVDSTILMALNRLKDLARDLSLTLVVTGLSFDVERHFEEAGHTLNEADGSCLSFVDLDHGMEWCENGLLDTAGALELEGADMAALLARHFPNPELLPEFLGLLAPRQVDKGMYVFRQGDPSDSMYLVRSGWVNVEIALETGRKLRVKKMGPGTVFGELGLFASERRMASVVASENCQLLMLTAEALARTRRERPDLAETLDRFVVLRLAGYLGTANAMVRDLMR